MFHVEFQVLTSLSTGSAPHPGVVNLGTGKRLAPRTPLSCWENQEPCLSHPSHWEFRSPKGTAGSSTCLCLCCASVTIGQDRAQVRIKATGLSKATAEQKVKRKVLVSISRCKVQGAADCDHNSPYNWLDANKHRLSIRLTVKPQTKPICSFWFSAEHFTHLYQKSKLKVNMLYHDEKQ